MKEHADTMRGRAEGLGILPASYGVERLELLTRLLDERFPHMTRRAKIYLIYRCATCGEDRPHNGPTCRTCETELDLRGRV